MPSNRTLWAEIDEQGRLVLPPELASRLGIKPGGRLRVEEDTNNLRLHRPTSHLAKIYIEPTNRCNITCRTCMRNTWDEPLGMMTAETFDRILAGLGALEIKPLVLFGGIGEPLFHRDTPEMVSRVKALGCPVELITNGTLLSERRSHELIDAGLDVLWVSLDGATPESYTDVRLGAALPQVLENLERMRPMRKGLYHPKPELGIAFVAMRRNINDLPKIVAIGRRLKATRFSISNVLPYTAELRDETLYNRTLKDVAYLESVWIPKVSLPKMDIDNLTREAFFEALRSGCSISFAGNKLSGANDVCTFIESGAMAIGWDGSVSPCPPLLHNHEEYLRERKRISKRHVIGTVADRDLLDLWNDPEYASYRDRVQGFSFPPCTFCGGCDMVNANEEDCIANGFPACGACLWAQGVIQCP